jgi:sugar phosphate permease
LEPRPLPFLHRAFPSLYYGWVVAGGGFLLAAVIVGLGFYSQAVFLDALCHSRGWSRASVAGATTFFSLASALTATFVGRSVDRHGARGWIVAGAWLMGVGLLGIGRVQSAAQLYAAYLAMAVGQGMGSLAVGAILTRWFVVRRARAITFAMTGVSVGGALVVPVASALISSRGLETAVAWLAVCVVGVATPTALFVLRFDPRDHGLVPDGEIRSEGAGSLLSDEVQRRDWRSRDALATPGFWLIAASFGAVFFAQNGFLLHEVAFLRERVGGLAAYAMSATALGSVAGRLVLGSFADRLPKHRVAQGVFLVQALTLALLAGVRSPAAVLACAALFGLTIGNVFIMQGLLAAEIFGMTSYGKVFGMIQLLTSSAAALGPLALGALFEALGGYAWGVAGFAAVPVVASLVIGLLGSARLPESRAAADASAPDLP